MTKSEASKQIAKILQEFEDATGEVVSGLSLIKIDATVISDERQQLHVSVGIETYRLPGHCWSTY